MFTKQIQEMVSSSYEMSLKLQELWIDNIKTYVLPMAEQIEKSVDFFKINK